MSASTPEAAASRRGSSRAAPYLHLLGLGAIALAQPLFDLLGRHPEFFVIRGSEPADLMILAVTLVLLVPLPLLALRAAAGLLGPRTAAFVQGALVAVLVTLLVAQMLRSADASEPVWLLAPLVGATSAALYLRLPTVRLFATFLAPAVLLLPAFFLLQPGVRGLLVDRGGALAFSESGASAPVFVLLFDELGLPSLLDAAGKIDRRQFPNLAELADGSTWFRDATTVAVHTSRAVPALLTGRHPRRGALPHLQDHPENLFTLLGGDYAVYAAESLTRLCPSEINRLERPVPSRWSRLGSLALDSGVVWLHLTLPPRLAEGLPPIDHAWGDFFAPWAPEVGGAAIARGPENDAIDEVAHRERVRASFGQRHELLPSLLEALGPDDRSLYFFHLLLPHIPWEYLPSGRRYQRLRDPVMVREGSWPDEEVPVAQTYARNLLQTMYTDQVVGRFMARLRDLDVYDRALVVVTSDHGATFRPGASRRAYQPDTAAEVLSVPLLIKAPGQREGRVVETPVSLVDVLPTLLDLLGSPIPAGLDGETIWDVQEARPRYVFDRPEGTVLPPLFEDVLRAARRLDSLVGGGVTPEELLRVGSHPELLGRSLVELGPIEQGEISVRVDGLERYSSVDPDASILPLLVSGTLEAPSSGLCCDLAIAVRGEVRATTGTLRGSGTRHRWAVLLPEDALEQGNNSLEVLVVRNGRSGPLLEWPQQRRRDGYELVLDEESKALAVVVGGVWFPVGRELRGWLGSAQIEGGEARITGWAADLEAGVPAEEVAFFHRDHFAATTAPALPNPGVVDLLGDPGFLESRFEATLPAQLLPTLEEEGIRAFALSSRGVAAELGYYYRQLEPMVGGGEALRSANGRLLRIDPGELRYWVDEVRREGEELVVVGWAADLVVGEPASRIVAMSGGRFHSETRPGESRPQLERLLGKEGLERSGFRFSFPRTEEAAMARGELRLFAVSGSRPVATELRLPLTRPREELPDASR